MDNLQAASVSQDKEKSFLLGNRYRVTNLVICLLVVVFVFAAYQFKILNKIELTTLDLRFKMRGPLKGSPSIVHIDIDEDSINQIGRWPWSREWHASLITALTDYKAKVTAFDIFFSEPSPLFDFFLVEVSKLAKDLVLALAFEYETRDVVISSSMLDTLKRFTISSSQIHGNKKNIPNMANPIPPLTEFYNTAHSGGHVNNIEDSDGVIRRAPSIIECKGMYYLHFSLQTALAYMEIDPRNIQIYLGKYIDLGNGTKIPIDKNGFIIVNWTAVWGKEFKHYSYWTVISSYQKALKGEEPLIDLSELYDKICIVGLTATGLIDIKPIPLQSAYPIAGLHSNMINTILTKKFIRELDAPLDLLIILALSVFVGLILPRNKLIINMLVAVLIMGLYCGLSFLVFKFFGLWINVVYSLSSVLLCFIGIITHSEIISIVDRARLFHLAVEDGLTKLYVIRHFKEIMQQEMTKAIRYRRPLALIISDIDHFKRINDSYGHLAGDFILKELANIFKTSCRDTDIAARYGGEEFVILLPETQRDGAVEFAERLRKLVEKLTIEYNSVKFSITVSFGVAELKDDVTPADFIKRADEALYVAKETGRNKVCFA